MLLFQFLYDIFVQNYVEMRYGWKLNSYLQKASKIFMDRPKAWILKCPELEGGKGIDRNWRSIDRMCFSSQFYFVAAHLTFGCLLTVYGLMVSLNGSGYKIFKDDLMPFLVAFVFALCHAAEILATKSAIHFRLWFRTGKEEAAELEEGRRQQRERSQGKLADVNVESVTGKSEASSYVQNKTLTMLVDESVLQTFRGAVQQVYVTPIGLTPTEMAMRINDQSATIKRALKARKKEFESGRTGVQQTKTSPASDLASDLASTGQHHEKGMGGEQATANAPLPQARRGSVNWGNMDHASAMHLDAALENQESTVRVKGVEKAGMKSVSKWVPIEYYGLHYIPGRDLKE